MARKPHNGSKARSFHRSLGAGAAVFVIFMVLSGLTLNHSNDLGLDQHHISYTQLLDWYGLAEPENIRSFAVGDHWLSFAGSQVYLDGESVGALSNGAGAVKSDELLIAAGSDELLLLDHSGHLVERMLWGPPGAGPIEAIGLLDDLAVVVRTTTGSWQANAQLLGWELSAESQAAAQWASSSPIPADLRQTIVRQYRGQGINLERLLLDIHSGRFFGKGGVIFYDLVALAVGFLAISGLIFWLRSKRNGKRKQSGQGQVPE